MYWQLFLIPKLKILDFSFRMHKKWSKLIDLVQSIGINWEQEDSKKPSVFFSKTCERGPPFLSLREKYLGLKFNPSDKERGNSKTRFLKVFGLPQESSFLTISLPIGSKLSDGCNSEYIFSKIRIDSASFKGMIIGSHLP
eukprot:GHVP01017332.1.p1 GENE.GHVP01017332.1~~GHVP01017332.1.p1  ORF type:complete len:140 (-),score=17.40 GHVP01017332.1:144-563(-)